MKNYIAYITDLVGCSIEDKIGIPGQYGKLARKVFKNGLSIWEVDGKEMLPDDTFQAVSFHTYNEIRPGVTADPFQKDWKIFDIDMQFILLTYLEKTGDVWELMESFDYDYKYAESEVTKLTGSVKFTAVQDDPERIIDTFFPVYKPNLQQSQLQLTGIQVNYGLTLSICEYCF